MSLTPQSKIVPPLETPQDKPAQRPYTVILIKKLSLPIQTKPTPRSLTHESLQYQRPISKSQSQKMIERVSQKLRHQFGVAKNQMKLDLPQNLKPLTSRQANLEAKLDILRQIPKKISLNRKLNDQHSQKRKISTKKIIYEPLKSQLNNKSQSVKDQSFLVISTFKEKQQATSDKSQNAQIKRISQLLIEGNLKTPVQRQQPIPVKHLIKYQKFSNLKHATPTSTLLMKSSDSINNKRKILDSISYIKYESDNETSLKNNKTMQQFNSTQNLQSEIEKRKFQRTCLDSFRLTSKILNKNQQQTVSEQQNKDQFQQSLPKVMVSSKLRLKLMQRQIAKQKQEQCEQLQSEIDSYFNQ